jgi:eukaryotic-like serine/threonine-protein kinase
MDFDTILLEIIDEFIDGRKDVIDKYCEKYPEFKDKIVSKLATANFIKQGLNEDDINEKKIGEYIILKEIGRGGMGIVLLGIHQALSRLTAIKVLPPSFSTDKEALTSFQDEAKIVAKFNHPNIVPIYSINQEKGMYYIAMGYITGMSLKDVLTKIKKTKTSSLKAANIKELLVSTFASEKDITQKSISLKRGLNFWNASYFEFIAKIFAEIANALDYAHQNGIYHGDVKPSNIILTNEGVPMILDFGLAQDNKITTSSKNKEFSGTLAYSAPEQVNENVVDDKTDIWSIGVVLYEALTSRNPFRSNTLSKTIDSVSKANPTPLKSYDKKIPVELEAITLKCLERKPENRYKSIKELAEDLENYLESKPTKAKPINYLGRLNKWIKRNPRLFFFAVSVITTLLTSTYFYSITFWRKTADTYFDKVEYNKAINMYTKILRLNPKDVQAYLQIASSYYLKGDYTEAISFYETALELEPNQPFALWGIGNVYYDMNEFNKAIEYYKKTLIFNPEDRTSLISLGTTYQAIESYDEAIYSHAKAVILAPADLNTMGTLVQLIEEEKEIFNETEILKYFQSTDFKNNEISSLMSALKNYRTSKKNPQ